MDVEKLFGVYGGVILVVLWTLHGIAKNLVMIYVEKKLNVCFRNSLAACVAFASEFGRFWCNLIFSGCA